MSLERSDNGQKRAGRGPTEEEIRQAQERKKPGNVFGPTNTFGTSDQPPQF